ncbi:flagellar protein FlhE [Aidingimonas lacisalsi]|uniref:flagellar protein FlhE n=1 Tax=Aidingimonas lacisalsi TaxID=2604086 RepID=UPI0013757C6C|nr:flagellar protein FlhE [Aidingimonas lacisalsi]
MTKRRFKWHVMALMGLACLLVGPLGPVALGVPGSWVGEPSGVRVAVAGRATDSERIRPSSEIAAGHRLQSVRWRFSIAPGHRVDAWLCHPAQCIPLSSQQGQSDALAGKSATQPLWFRFRLPDGATAVSVTQLQLIAEFR